MPSWGSLLRDLNDSLNPLDIMRRKYLGIMNQYTERNIIAYYSAFIQKPSIEITGIDDNDKNAFMQAVCGLDRSKGLDLLLHTPGGAISATESIVYYLKSLFGNDIRVFVPQIAMSAGTMMALSAKEIVLGKQSNLGPIDPQFGGVSCSGIIEEFNNALDDVKNDPSTAQIWSEIIGKYHPTFIGDCKKAIKWSESITTKWLIDNMFCDSTDSAEKAQKVISALSDHSSTYSHSRHIHRDELKELGLRILDLEGLDNRKIEDCNDLQDCVLTIHHSYMHTFGTSNAVKIIENHCGSAMIINSKKGRTDGL
jgi:hypothetical protein